MNYRQLKYFTVVARLLNFSKAAAELYVSQPALSKHIAELEKYFGTALFLRTNRNLVLTEAGKVLLDEAESIFAKEPEILRKVSEASGKRTGKLTIAFISTSLSFHIPLLVKQFNHEYPLIEVNLQRLPWGNVERAVSDKQADLGFMISLREENAPVSASYVLTHTYPAVVVAKDHPLADRNTIHMAQLKDEQFILVSQGAQPSPYEYTIRLCQNAGFTPNITTTCPLAETALMLVQAGLGISILSRLAPVQGMNNVKFIDINPDEANYTALKQGDIC